MEQNGNFLLEKAVWIFGRRKMSLSSYTQNFSPCLCMSLSFFVVKLSNKFSFTTVGGGASSGHITAPSLDDIAPPSSDIPVSIHAIPKQLD